MDLKLIDGTGFGIADRHARQRYAAAILIFSKSTRLVMSPSTLEDIHALDDAEMQEELKKIAATIPSSWEFIEFTFVLNNVTRAFTHQFVRTRHASFAQQTMRVLNVDGWTFGTGPTIMQTGRRATIYNDAMRVIADSYEALIANGAAIEDARGILPTNIHTNIVAKMNMRTLIETVRKRSSSRVQGEYREVVEKMKSAVMEAYPWFDVFFAQNFDNAAAELEAKITDLFEKWPISDEQRLPMIKLIDRMRESK